MKLALAMFPLILFFMMFSFFVVLRHETNILESETRLRGSSLAAGLAIISGEAMRTFSDFQLEENLDQFAKLKDVRYALILNQDGRIVASTDNSQLGLTPDDPVNISAQEASAERTRKLEFGGEQVLDVSQPILVAGRRLGTVRIGLGLDALHQALAQSRRYLQGLTLLLLSGAIIFAALLARRFTRPLLRLATTARQVAGGDLQARAKEDSNDELGLLGKTINRMATRLQTMLEREKTARKQLQMRV
ncbi:MAG: HAMP domain-containing protein, partial [Candidatus Eremiobacteraeota bacterium]|nr:HAMP domain-containing protein [Candidatus Eremiobacteraeota bacterium]